MSKLSLRAVKLKVGQSPETDLEVLRAAREIFGSDCSLRVDANCAWDAKTALAQIESFEPFRLDAVEQPLPADDLDGLAWLTARSRVPIVVDESLVSAEDARALAERRACHLFNVRISKCGGLLNSARIRAIGEASGIGSMLGAQVGETALLSAAGRHFATRCEGVRFFEGSYGKLLLEEDIAVQDITVGGEGAAAALEGPGLGVDVDEARLSKYAKERERIR
jgi:muconate cycloisomerase